MTQVCNGSFEIVRRCSVKSDLLNVSRTPNSLAHDPQVGEALSSHPRVWRIDREAPQSSGSLGGCGCRRLLIADATANQRTYQRACDEHRDYAQSDAPDPASRLRQCVLPSPSAGRACRVPERRVRCEERTRQLSANGASLGRRYCPDRSASGFRARSGAEPSDPPRLSVTTRPTFRDQRAPAHGEQPTLLRERDVLATPGA